METATMTKLEEMTLDIEQSVDINAPIAEVFKAALHRFGEANVRPDGEPMQMKLEPWAGGRWYRDRGNDITHLWGHVQVMKPPVLIEVSGPLFMSYPAINHVELKFHETASGTRVTLRHRAIGMLEPDHKTGVQSGWGHMLDLIKRDLS